MKTCPKCSTPNQDEFMFCENCGANLAEVKEPADEAPNTPVPADTAAPVPTNTAAPVPANSAPVSPAPVNTAPANAVPNRPAAAPTPVVPGNPAPKKSSPVTKIVLACAALLVLVFIISSLFNSNPTYKLLNGLAKMAKFDKSTIDMNVKIGYDGNDEGEFLNDLTFKTAVATDTKNLLAQTTVEVLYNNKSLAKAVAGLNNEDVYVDLMNLYKDSKFYEEMDTLVPDYQDYINDAKIVIKALDGVNLKLDKKKYADIIKDVLGKDIKKSGSKITVTLDAETAIELMSKVLDEAKDDEKLMKSVRTNAVNVFKKLLKDKKKLEIIEADQLETALETLEDENDFEDMYQSALDEALSSLEYSADSLDEELPEMKMTFKFGLFNKITGIEYAMNVDDGDQSIDVSLKADIKNGASFTKYNKKDAIEIKDLLTDEDKMSEVSETVTENLVKSIEKNDKLVEEIEDASGQDIDDAIDSLIQGMVYSGF